VGPGRQMKEELVLSAEQQVVAGLVVKDDKP
jgi:hypothetical protein